jgi:ribosomal protein S27AE
MKMCTYCAKWFPEEQMKQLPNDERNKDNRYCPKCYPEVLSAHNNLPWNRQRRELR